jgi:protein O-GlcNAc transferase
MKLILILVFFLSMLTPARLLNSESTRRAQGSNISEPADDTGALEEAQHLSDDGRLKESVDAYRRFLKDHPANESALFGMALALSKMGMIDDSVLAYEAALKTNPKLWEAETNLGMLWLSRRIYDRASEHLKKAQALNPGNFQIALLHAQAEEALDKVAAIQQYERALSLAHQAPQQFEAHASLGRIYFQHNNWLEAEKHYLAAKQVRPESLEVDFELAQVYFQSGEQAKCVEALQRLVKRPESGSPVFEVLARAYEKNGQADRAIQSLETALTREKDNVRKQQISYDLARLYEASDQTDKAILLLGTYASSSQNADLHFHLGTLYLKRKQLDQALLCFSRVLNLKPGCIECYSNIGSIFLLQEKYAESLTAFQHFKSAKPDVAGTYFYMALAFDKLDQVDQAFQHYQRFLELDGGKSDKQDFQARERMKVLEKRLKKR